MNIFHIIRDAWVTAIIFSILPQLVHRSLSTNGLFLALAFGMGYAVGFALNNYFDRELDAADPDKAKRNFFVQNDVPKSILYALLALTFAFFVYVAAQFGWKGFVALFGLSFFMWSYSSKPLHFKTRTGWDIIIHALFVQTAPYISTLWLMELDFFTFDYLMIIILMLSSTSGQLAGQLRDFEVDSKTHQTTAHLLGYERTKVIYYVILGLIIGFFILGLVLNIIVYFLIPLGVLGVFFLVVRSTTTVALKSYRKYIDPVLAVIALTYITVVVAMLLLFPSSSDILLRPY